MPAVRGVKVYVPPLVVISLPAGLPVLVPLQLTLYGAVPPVAVITPEPLLPPLHDTLVEVFVAMCVKHEVRIHLQLVEILNLLRCR